MMAEVETLAEIFVGTELAISKLAVGIIDACIACIISNGTM